jgi:ketosteroid isomerase-like protein
MSVNELQALAKQFADAFDQRDLKTLLGMLSDDLEVFDQVPFRFDGKRSSPSISTRWWRAWPQRASASGNHRAACMAIPLVS